MNSNRMKYASTPTYGMQKRNFAKKQAAAQTTPTPDFTQPPAMEPSASGVPFTGQSPFMMPPSVFPGAASQQSTPFYYPGQQASPSMGSPSMGIPSMGTPSMSPSSMGTPSMMPNLQGTFSPNAMPNLYPNLMPQTQNANLFPPPLGNASLGNGNAGFSPRNQGYMPAGFPQGNAAVPPNVIRSDTLNGYSGASGMPGLSGMQGMPMGANLPLNAMGNAAPYSGGGYGPGAMNGAPASYGGYASAPMGSSMMGMNGMNRAPYPSMEGGGPPAMPTPRPPTDPDKIFKVILFGVLPVLFIPCVFVSHTFDFLRYAFLIASVITLSVIWYRQTFGSALRTGISIVYLVLCIITLAMLISGNRDVTQTAASGSQNGVSQATPEPSASVEAMPLAAQETPAPEEDLGESEAEQRLSTFMDYWAVNKIEDMVNLVQPSWASTQDSPAQALFTLISNRTPTEYEIESISGTSADSSRTVTMSAYIDKNNGKDPVRYRFMILMVKESGEWYVDPNSLATNDTVETTTAPVAGKETVVQSLAPRMTVTPVPDASTKLYYNATGGKYYHLDPNCSAVNPKYLPMASFLYSELDDPPYSSLQPCLKCGAPTQSLKSLEEATATPTAAP